METKTLMLGIEKEFEGDSPLWFDLNEPEKLAQYVKDNLNYGDKYEISLKEFEKSELEELDY